MRAICSVVNCSNFVHGNKLCSKHYARVRRGGTIDIECVGQSRPGNHNGMFGIKRCGITNPFFGKRHTEEAKAKNRQAHMGKIPTPEQNKRMSEKLKGRIPYWLKGKALSEEHKMKIKISVPRGANSPHWKGGITSINAAVRASPQYHKWSRLVKERDNYTCVLCGYQGRELHADHIKPFYSNPELRFELTNGRTLCVPCHRNTETYGRPK